MPLAENLEHARLRWNAEEEYARRLGTRVQILATVTLGFFGVVLVQSLQALLSGRFPDDEPWWAPYLVGTLLGVGLLFLLWACAHLFDVLRRRSGEMAHSSGFLVIPKNIRDALEVELLDALTEPNPKEGERRQAADLYRYHAAWTLDRAADNLNSRNRAENERIRKVQIRLLIGLVCVVLGFMAWVYTGPRGDSDGREARRETLAGCPGDPGSTRVETDRRTAEETPRGSPRRDETAQPNRAPASGEAR